MKVISRIAPVFLMFAMVLAGCDEGGDKNNNGTDMFTVTFDKNLEGAVWEGVEGNPDVITVTVTANSSLGKKMPNPPKAPADYEFTGWMDESNVFNDKTKVTGNITVLAQWRSTSTEPFTVTFNLNHTDSSGSSPVPSAINDVTPNTTITLPVSPTRSEGWGAGMVFRGWFRNSNGTGARFTGETPVMSNIVLYAKWEFVPGIPEAEGQTLTHKAPQVFNNDGDWGVQGAWAGTMEADGSVTYSSGAIRYQFPDSIEDYDYFTLEYIANNSLSVILKQFDNGDDYPPIKINGADSTNLYPALGVSGSIEFEINGASRGGAALQRNTGAGNPLGDRTVKIVNVTFTKGTRHTITFDPGGFNSIPYTGDTWELESRFVLEGSVVGTLPFLNWTGYDFKGWYLNDTETIVLSSTKVTPAFAGAVLKARWTEKSIVTVNPLTVIFNNAGDFIKSDASASVTVLPEKNGYVYEYGSMQYQDAWVKFSVDFGAGVKIGDYSTVQFTMTGLQGNTMYKPVKFLAGSPLPSSFSGEPPLSSEYVVSTTQHQYNAPSTINFTIDKSKVINLTASTIEISIYIHAEKADGSTPTQFEFKDIIFTPAQ